ncbi:MAG: hypothetical protein ACREUY_01505 [Burkholderiales bacterium]
MMFLDGLLVLLPVILNAEELLEHGYRYGSAWFFDAEARWDKSKTDKGLRGHPCTGSGASRCEPIAYACAALPGYC